jgi:hypothetical protein
MREGIVVLSFFSKQTKNILFNKRIKREAKLIAGTLFHDNESPLFENITSEARHTLFNELLKLMKDKDVFGYYYQAETIDHEPKYVIYKILTNLYAGLRKNVSPRLMFFLGQTRGIKLLFMLYPEIHQLGLKDKRLNLEHFDDIFSNLNIEEMESYLATNEPLDYTLQKMRVQLGLNKVKSKEYL